MIKKNTTQVFVGNIAVGGGSPVVIQSMTNTNTADRKATTNQIIELWQAGSEIVRITVNDEESASQVANIKKSLLDKVNLKTTLCFIDGFRNIVTKHCSFSTYFTNS